MPARRPTIADVARQAGVSKGAVSFALNGRAGVGPQTRERILAAASELGWSPNHRARALSTSRAFALGLVGSTTSNSPAMSIPRSPRSAPTLADGGRERR